MDLEEKIVRLEKRIAREKAARLEAEKLLEEKSRAMYAQNVNLQENARLLEATVVNARDGVVITTADLEGDGPKIIYVNEAFANITGYSAEEAIGRTPRILQGKETQHHELDRLKEALKAGKPFEGEVINYHKNGTPYWLDISIVPIHNEDGQITHFTAIERDITEKKRVETQIQDYADKLELLRFDALEAKKKAEAASQAKSEFLANMSHELRTPMNGIIGMTEILLDSGLNMEQLENAEILRASSDNLLTILNDILDISKIEAGELTIENVPYHMETAVRQIIQLFLPIALDQGVDLLFESGENVPPMVRGDLGRLQQILRNLISNALKFTEYGHIKVIVKAIERGGDMQLYFAVEDTGIGIPKDKLHSIFEKFTQADTSVTRKFGGTGLGLAITQQLVELMGGDISVDSIEGQGATFWFTLPLVLAGENDRPVNLYDDKSLQDGEPLNPNVRVLAVDDHPVNRVFIQKVLKKFGLTRVDMAEDGQQALDKIKKNQYDVVLMDCQMPELDGYEATRLLRVWEEDENAGARLPVIALTANAMVGDREKCMRAGMDDYLSKPIKPDKLLALLKRWAAEAGDTIDISDDSKDDSVHDPSSAAIDMAHLHMFTDGNREDEEELFGIFSQQADLSIEALTAALHSHDHDAWRSAAHRLKGSAANLGAHMLSELCAQAEQQYEIDPDVKEKQLHDIGVELSRVRTFWVSR
jgi:PAS domain S-box-containing protein